MTGVSFIKVTILGRSEIWLDWSFFCRQTSIMTQPFYSWLMQIFCFDSISSCMGNMKVNSGEYYICSCVFHRLCYILEGFGSVEKYNLQSSCIISKNLILSLLFLSSMALLNWVPPPLGTLKVNVHASAFHQPMPNGNTVGIGVVLRTSEGDMVNCIAGTIQG